MVGCLGRWFVEWIFCWCLDVWLVYWIVECLDESLLRMVGLLVGACLIEDLLGA